MRRIAHWLPLCLITLLGCSPPHAVSPASSGLTPVLGLKQMMEWVIDPAADVIWDSVKSITTEAGTKDIAPQNAEQWDAVRNAAATLMEASNLLMVPGRARDERGWAAFARGLRTSAGGALKAAEAKNTEALFAAGGDIYVVCRGCHTEYAKHLNSSADPTLFGLRPAHSERAMVRHERLPAVLTAAHGASAQP
jgi:cytochrome c553